MILSVLDPLKISQNFILIYFIVNELLQKASRRDHSAPSWVGEGQTLSYIVFY